MSRFPVNNLAVKILAITLAVILWIYVMYEQNPPVEQVVTVPLEYRNVAAGLIALDPADTVKVKIRGPRTLTGRDQLKELHAYVDAAGLQAGKHAVSVHAVGPKTLSVVEATPDNITLVLESMVYKRVQVQTNVTGTPVEGAVVGKVAVEPDVVQMNGPSSFVYAVAAATVTVDISGSAEDVKRQVKVQLIGHDGQIITGIDANPAKVNVVVPITKTTHTKKVEVKFTTTGQLPSGVTIEKIEINPGFVTIRGSAETLKNIDSVLTAPINLVNVDKDIAQEMKLQLPNGVAVEQGGVVTIAITLSQRPPRATLPQENI